ncbi:MAG: hypothetical protein IT567_01145 [Alphaproteobacteria bacterium]|nr:hypothetical protein [Alphaproteobacteria bacterium]
MRAMLRTDGWFYLFLLLQISFGIAVYDRHPTLDIVPPVPGKTAVQALAFGDEEAYFRVLGLELQNYGDTFGRFTALKHYDYKTLAGWLSLLDTLDNRSNLLPALASYYYSQTQNVQDVRYMVDYLAARFEQDPAQNWWWMGQAVYLANHTLKDKTLALDLAYRLAKTPGDVPMWTRQMPAFILEEMGEKEAAMAIIVNILDSYKDLSDGERNFMHYFL